MFALPNNIKIGRIEFQICDLSNISKPEPDDDEDSKLEKINFQKDVVDMENNLLTPKLHSFVGTYKSDCSYCYSVLFDLIPLLMCCMESYLSNKPKQCIY